MLNWIAENRPLILIVFFLFLTALEVWMPILQLKCSIIKRWFTNFCLFAINTFLSKALYLLPGLWMADWSNGGQYSLFNWVPVPLWIMTATGIIVLDVKNYFMHRALHHLPWLWRLHKVHHSEIEIDITTSFRFHPGEGIITIVTHMMVVFALGLSADAVMIIWVILSFWNQFTHGNIAMPEKLDRLLQKGVITANVHRLHHSTDRFESNKNFGTLFVFWDKLFNTYLIGTQQKQQRQQSGLIEYRKANRLNLLRLLFMPFKTKAVIEQGK